MLACLLLLLNKVFIVCGPDRIIVLERKKSKTIYILFRFDVFSVDRANEKEKK